jgi:hypothetical protein
MLIDERAAAARANEAAAPGANTGLLARRQKNLRDGKKTHIVEEWTYDSAVIGDLAMMLKQAAIEAGEWQEEGRVLPPATVDVSDLTDEQLIEEQKILREARERLEANRAGKPIPLQIDAIAEAVVQSEPDAITCITDQDAGSGPEVTS